MTTAQYERWTTPFRGRREGLIPTADRLMTALVFAAYPALLLFARWQTGRWPWLQIWVPASWLVIVSLLRVLVDRKRPYEQLAIRPLIRRESSGRSFPSRHAFSVWMIAMTGWVLCPPAGAALSVLGVLLCLTRVLGGVHFPTDVLTGAAVGIFAGLLGYWWLPL